jgi:hypothetical protein
VNGTCPAYSALGVAATLHGLIISFFYKMIFTLSSSPLCPSFTCFFLSATAPSLRRGPCMQHCIFVSLGRADTFSLCESNLKYL